MDKQEFISALLENGEYKELAVMKRLFSKPTNSKFTTVKDGKVYYGEEELTFAKLDKQLLQTNDKYTIGKLETTVGRAIVNALIQEATNNKIQYVNKPFTLKYPVSLVKAGLGKEFTLQEYKNICRVAVYIIMITPYIVVSATMKTVSPIKGIEKEKQRVAKELSKISPNWQDDDTMVLQFEAEVMKFVKNYYSDDPTYGITFVGKTVGSVKKQFVSVGIGSTPDPHGKSKTIIQSLNEGIQLTHAGVASTNNTVRAGSAGRGIDTRDGGVTFKTVVQASHYIKIVKRDCKTKDRFPIRVTPSMSSGLLGLYHDDNVLIDEEYLQKNMGKVINIRTPALCKSGSNTRCSYCCGEELSLSPNGITLMAIKVGSQGVLAALAKFHQSTDKLTKVTIQKIFA